ncbi:MAG: hypothetical protein QM796_12100 [Chthoniobacteraceae bacterium]
MKALTHPPGSPIFTKKKLPTLGWALEKDERKLAGLVFMNFTQAGQTAKITITDHKDKPGSTVLLETN